MRLLVDQETGELVEVLDTQVVGLEPYDYRQAKAANMRASMERRQAVQTYTDAIQALAKAEREYRRLLAIHMIDAKQEHGATMAEQVAKGHDEVLDARQGYVAADGLRYAALEVIRTCDGDRTGLTQLTRWSENVSKWEESS